MRRWPSGNRQRGPFKSVPRDRPGKRSASIGDRGADRGAMLASRNYDHRPSLTSQSRRSQQVCWASSAMTRRGQGDRPKLRSRGKKFDQSRKENLFRSETFSRSRRLGQQGDRDGPEREGRPQDRRATTQGSQAPTTFLKTIVDNLKDSRPVCAPDQHGYADHEGPRGNGHGSA
jgi:hypothetical protein